MQTKSSDPQSTREQLAKQMGIYFGNTKKANRNEISMNSR